MWDWLKNKVIKQPVQGWWYNSKCSSCQELVTKSPHNSCGHCKRIICATCGYIPGGCGWCAG